jgi:uncharacterized membrane protein
LKISFKRLLLYLAIAFYFGAGLNHFANPEFYLPLIPPGFGNKEWINIAAGIAEIIAALGLMIPVTRRWAAYGLILLLIAFIPSHIYFIQIGTCVSGSLCVDEWIAWARLVLSSSPVNVLGFFHPQLI